MKGENKKLRGVLHVGKRIAKLSVEGRDEKVNIRKKHIHNALHGDKVEVGVYSQGKSKAKKFGQVITVLERNKSEIKGRLDFDGEYYFFIPDDFENYIYDFHVPKKYLNGAKDGDDCFGRFFEWEDENTNPKLKISRILGNSNSAKSKLDYIIGEFDLPEEFPSPVIKESDKAEHPRPRKKYPERLDLRKEIIVTIDPDDAKDFDDALSLKILENDNLELGVHIADVSHYVDENSEIDIEARLRGNSTYLADRVVPMLPEKLSNDICSLRPNEVRFAHSCFIEYSSDFEVVNYQICETVIKSKRRFTYDEALEIIKSGKGKKSDYPELISRLNSLAENLRQKRFEGGGINFETFEVRFQFDQENNPVNAKQKSANLATKMVEECMLAANKVVASHFKNLTKKYSQLNLLPSLYRVHENPDKKLMGEAITFISSLGKKFSSKNINSRNINKIIEHFQGLPEFDMVNSVLIRSLPKAYYSEQNYGHFGLGFTDYTHFTSPIRRYADLVIHRLLKEYSTGKPDVSRLRYLKVFAISVAKHCSETERHSMSAERASRKLTSAIMLENRLGDEFNGTVTGIVSYGFFVMVDDVFAEGLVRIKSVPGDYYVFEEKKYRFVGKNSKKVIRIGSRVKVQLLKVNIEKKLIDFDYIGEVEK